MNYPLPSNDLHAHLAWIRTIVPLKVGTIVQFLEQDTSMNLADRWKPGSYFKVTSINDSINSKNFPESKYGQSQKRYTMVLCTKAGKEYKKTYDPLVISIEKWILDKKAIVQE